jgi:hypothetical protein
MKLLKGTGALLSHAVAFLMVAWLTAAAAGIFDWSKTAGSNTTLEGISWAEGMSPAGVNNGIRAIAAALKEWQEDLGGGLTAGGTADALTLTTNSGIASYADGVRLSFVAASSNTGAATLNVDGIGAKAIRKVTLSSTNDAALAANDMRANGHYAVEYDASANSAAGAWILLNPAPAVVGTDVQAHDAELAAWAGLTSAADTLGYFSGSGTATTTTLSAFARSFIDDVDEAAFKATVNLEANADFYTPGGTDVALADGGTGASLVDPNADRFLFWDDSAGAIAFGAPAIGQISGTSIVEQEVICVATSDETTAITTGTAKITFRMPFGMTVTAVRASVNTASSSGMPTVDINDSGTTILSTKLTIDANEKTSTSAASAAVISDTALADDAEITMDHDVAGTGTKGMKVCIIGNRA